jgi:hypothetical protein
LLIGFEPVDRVAFSTDTPPTNRYSPDSFRTRMMPLTAESGLSGRTGLLLSSRGYYSKKPSEA